MAANITFHSSHGLAVTVPQRAAVKRQPFDELHCQKLIRARGETIRNLLQRVKPLLTLSTTVDAGAGVGFFSQTLLDCGLNVCGFDGRAENVSEARRRFPHIPRMRRHSRPIHSRSWGNSTSRFVSDCCLFVVGSVFASLPAVEWLTGRPTRFNPNGMTVDIRDLPSWSRYRFLAGANKYIQQESTFWRRSL